MTERPEPTSKDGWDITVWVGESYSLTEEIFDAITRLIEYEFDYHGPDDECVISWGMSMSPAKFDDNEEEIKDEN